MKVLLSMFVRSRFNFIALFIIVAIPACNGTSVVEGVSAHVTPLESIVTSVTSGTVRSEKMAELAFSTVGRVEILNVSLGSQVKQGEILAVLENGDLRAALTNAETELIRRSDLKGSHAVSKSDIDLAARRVDEARAFYEKSIIRAPFSGIITEVNLEVGQLSQITTIIPKPPIHIIDLGPRYVRAEIDEIDLTKIYVGAPARVKILAARREPYYGVVRKVIPFIMSTREQDRTSEVELSINTNNELLPVGASADVEIIVEQKPSVLTIPTKALLGRGEDRFVYRLLKGRAIRTPVRSGIINFEQTEITSGISEGEIVLIPSDDVELSDQLAINARVS